jgi:hypothetical protein
MTTLSNRIITDMRSANMPKNTRKKSPSPSAMAECARVCRDLADAADWFHVDWDTFDHWLRENPKLAREWRRAKLEDVREMRLILREKAVASGSPQAVEKYLKLSYPDAFNEKTQLVTLTVETRVLPAPDSAPLVIEHESD